MAKISFSQMGHANPVSLTKSYPLDGRQLLIIDDANPSDDDITSYMRTVKGPYLHLQVHLHRKESDNSLTCLGVYEVDETESVADDPYFPDMGSHYEIKTFHKVFSTTSGLHNDYKPNGSHKNVIYYCTDQNGDYVGKVYLNGVTYGGSDVSFTADQTAALNSGITSTKVSAYDALVSAGVGIDIE